MAKKKGICRNYGECELADNREIQEVESTDFVCSNPECGQELYEIPTPSSPVKWKYILLALVVLALVGGGAYFLLGSGGSQSEPTKISLSKQVGEMTVGAVDTLQAFVTPKGATPQLKWASNDTSVLTVENGVVKAVAPGTAKIGVQVVENKELKAFCEYTVKGSTGKNTPPAGKKTTTTPSPDWFDFGFGNYKGNMKNGVPHGEGNITITRTVTIDCNNMDGETITLHKGDKITRAEIRNGYLQSGYFTISGDERYVDGLNVRLE